VMVAVQPANIKPIPGHLVCTTASRASRRLLLLVNAVARASTAGCGLVLERSNVLIEWAMFAHLEDGLGLDGFELGLEVFGAFGVGGRVGATAGVIHVQTSDVFGFLAWVTPVALSSTVFLSLLWVSVEAGVLAEELGQIVAVAFLLEGSFAVDTIGKLVGASHDGIESVECEW